ncbi:peptide ABC transporter ATPase [Desulfuromonas soudanensis]|uniref:Peptide ABC transporter ATPase n=1 Tax=Desulfuromonas soudanensis TaxID=1603606 RepID=A0A0M4DGD9_9BACT|nr:ABC transporter ATP-binding protein [Desulfuromonas soudanensis]ALC15925.1 peptide ABC transporter ATPase [Desulfuromonas soudanensis]
MQPLLDVRNLTTYFFTAAGLVKAVRGIDFTISVGKTLALVGESGCGKSMTALSLLRLVPSPGRIVDGEIYFAGEDLLHKPAEEMRRTRGNRIAMIFQEPMTSLNPVFRVGEQIAEVLRLHKGLPPKEALDAAATLLQQVGIPAPQQRIYDYPHQLSGGMRQRVMIAMALACDPQLLIADEPTTALDVTIQAQIIDLLTSLKAERQMATLLITHDLGVVAETADQVAVMYNGLIMEYADVATIFANPLHPYTLGLMNCIPRLGGSRGRLATIPTPPAGAEPGTSFLDLCPHPFAPRRGKLPLLREVEAGHLVRCWED